VVVDDLLFFETADECVESGLFGKLIKIHMNGIYKVVGIGKGASNK
jgi:hypothetical protein